MEQAGYLQNSLRLLNSLRAEQQSEAPSPFSSLTVPVGDAAFISVLFLFLARFAVPWPQWPCCSSHILACSCLRELSLSLPSTWNSLPPGVCMTCFLPSFRELLKCCLRRKVLLKLSIENSSIPSPHAFIIFFS